MVTALALLADMAAIFLYAPVEAQMGLSQKIFYLHVPSAYSMYVGFGLCVLGSAVYLVKRNEGWEALAAAGAEVGLMFWVIVVTTGPLWGRKAWGVYWTWDPRLTTNLLLGMIYTAYLLLRNLGSSGESERKFAAGLGLIGGFLMPIIHYSVTLWRGQHPTVITNKGGGLDPRMAHVLFLSLFAFTLFNALLIWQRLNAERARRRIENLAMDAAEHGLLEEA